MIRLLPRRLAPLAASSLAALGLLALPGSAHHSTAMFEWGQEARLENLVVERWVWTNPHTYIYARDAAGNQTTSATVRK